MTRRLTSPPNEAPKSNLLLPLPTKAKGASQAKAILKPCTSCLLAISMGGAFVFSSYSLRILLVFSSYSPGVASDALRQLRRARAVV